MERHSSKQLQLEQEQRRFEIASKVASGQVIAQVIHQDRLPSFLRAALATGFEVEKIADEGEEFPYPDLAGGNVHMQMKFEDEGFQRKVSDIKVYGKGYIAVSIEGPEGIKDYTPFWDNLRSLEQKKA